MTLEVYDESGKRLPAVKILSAANHDLITDDLGQSTFFFYQSGLHIVTLQSFGTLAKQVEIRVPSDANKIIVVGLESK